METGTKLVFDELLEAATAGPGSKFKPRGKDEDRQAFLGRLVERVAEVPQEEFDKLSEGAQNWYNSAVDQLNEDKPIDAPEGYGEAEGDASDTRKKANGKKANGKKANGKKAAAPPPTKDKTTAKGKTATKPADKKGAAKAADKKKEPRTPKPPKEKLVGLARVRPREGASVGRTIREALVVDQSLSADDLRDRLKKAGFSNVPRSTISTMTADIMRTLYVASQHGLFKPNPPLPRGASA